MRLDDLVEKAQAGDDEAFSSICQSFEGLVKKHAFQQHMRPIASEALAEGQLAVVQAVRLYDPALGVNFAGFVESRVKYAVWNMFKRERRRWQHEIPLEQGTDENELNFAEVISDGHDMEAEIAEVAVTKEIMDMVRILPEKQCLIIFKTLIEECSLTQVARNLGITPQAAHNLRKRGLARLKMVCAGMYASEGGERDGCSKNTAKH